MERTPFNGHKKTRQKFTGLYIIS